MERTRYARVTGDNVMVDLLVLPVELYLDILLVYTQFSLY